MTSLVLPTTEAMLNRVRRPGSDGTLVLQRIISTNSGESAVHSGLSATPNSRILKHVQGSSAKIFKPDDSESTFTLIRANLEKSDDGSILDVVLKLGLCCDMDDEIRLTYEMNAYETHGAVLAGYLPPFHGLFETTDKYARVLCLVTEYSGEPMIGPMYRAERTLIWKVIIKAAQLHALGFRHGCLKPRNILVNNDGMIRFIDLRSLSPHHCERSLRIKADCAEPGKFFFGCDELYDLVGSAKVWKSNYVEFLGQFPILMPPATVEDVLFGVPSYHLKNLNEEQLQAYRVAAAEFVNEAPKMTPEQSPLLAKCPASEDVI